MRHPDFRPRLRKLQLRGQGSKKTVEPLEFAKVVREEKLRTVKDMHAYANAKEASGFDCCVFAVDPVSLWNSENQTS